MTKVEKLLELAKENFEQGEEVLSFVDGAFQTTIKNRNTVRTGILIATNKKLRFCGKRFFFIYDDIIEYRDIYKVEITKEKLGDTMFIDGKKKSYFMKYVISKELGNFFEVVQEYKGKRL